MTGEPRLRRARFEDYPAIHRLSLGYFRRPLSVTEWRRLFTANPLWPRVGDDWPIGWLLEDADSAVVGSFSNVPSAYRFLGEERVCANGNRWAVLPAYRGYAALLMDEHFNQPGAELMVNTTVAASAAPVISCFADRVPLGDWSTRAFRVLDYPKLARLALRRRGVPGARLASGPCALALAARDTLRTRPLTQAPPGVEISTVGRFGVEFDRFWRELVRRNPEKLLAVRDAGTLEWHFGDAIRAGRYQVYTAARAGALLAYCVVGGYHYAELGLHSLRIVDYHCVDADTDLLPGLLRGALSDGGPSEFDIVETLGSNVPKMRLFEEFALARSTKASWSFYYQATNPELKAALSKPEVWDPSGYDGDASYL